FPAPLRSVSHLRPKLQNAWFVCARLPYSQHSHPYRKLDTGVFSGFIDVQDAFWKPGNSEVGKFGSPADPPALQTSKLQVYCLFLGCYFRCSSASDRGGDVYHAAVRFSCGFFLSSVARIICKVQVIRKR